MPDVYCQDGGAARASAPSLIGVSVDHKMASAAGQAARLAAAGSSTTLTPAEINQLSQDLHDPKKNELSGVLDILSEGLQLGDLKDSGELMLDLYEALDGVDADTGAVNNQVGNLTKGVTSAQATKLWELYDHDGDGTIDRGELRRLVHDLGNAIIRKLSMKVERISKQMSEPKAAAASLLKAFDTSHDGKVQKDEFVRLAMNGVRNIDAVTDDGAPPAKRAKAAADPAANEARKTKAAGRGQPGFEMIHMMMLRVANLKQGLSNLATGVTEAEADALWKTFDADGDGTLDLGELQALFAEQATTAIQAIYSRIAAYADALSKSATVDDLLDRFDEDGDGKVQKAEFIALAVKGVRIPCE